MKLVDEAANLLRERQPAAPLYPSKVWKPDLSERILSAGAEELCGSNVPAADVAPVRAGLLLMNDDLDASHTIAQGIETPTGSFWHAIMHRREGDAANSSHWWRRTGNHPAFPEVHKAVLKSLENEEAPAAREFAALLKQQGEWQAVEFVAVCEKSRGGDDGWLRRAQIAEMSTLLDWCLKNND